MGGNRIILDAGALTALATENGPLRLAMRRAISSGVPVCVPAPVLVETITGGGPLDARINQALKACLVLPLEEAIARAAGALRYRRPGSGAVDAMVVAFADVVLDSIIITGDAGDLRLLAAKRSRSIVTDLNNPHKPRRIR
jgi:predicted nucleic acid-binding protein